jgi:hypothetical protein
MSDVLDEAIASAIAYRHWIHGTMPVDLNVVDDMLSWAIEARGWSYAALAETKREGSTC